MRGAQDEEALRSAMERHAKTVYAVAFVRTGSRPDAEDIVQDVFLQYCTKMGTFESDEHERRWLIRTAVSRSIDVLRSAWRRRVIPCEEPRPADDPVNTSGLGDLLEPLKPRERLVLLFRYVFGYTCEEIAGMTGESPASVRKRLSRTKQRLKEEQE